MPAFLALQGFGDPRSFGLVRSGLDYRSRHALGLGDRPVGGGRCPGTTDPSMPWDLGTGPWEGKGPETSVPTCTGTRMGQPSGR